MSRMETKEVVLISDRVISAISHFPLLPRDKSVLLYILLHHTLDRLLQVNNLLTVRTRQRPETLTFYTKSHTLLHRSLDSKTERSSLLRKTLLRKTLLRNTNTLVKLMKSVNHRRTIRL